MTKRELLERFKIPDAFADAEPVESATLWGWHGEHPVFETVIAEVRPKLIIEVGSWMGLSTVSMARALKKHALFGTPIICVDTWLGSIEHWMEDEWRPKLELSNGYPSFYKNFLSNILQTGHADDVVPLPMPSLMGARFLDTRGIKADVIYIDGSHDEEDVYRDAKSYWNLLAPGGMMFGDDFPLPGVGAGIVRFTRGLGLQCHTTDVYWMVRK